MAEEQAHKKSEPTITVARIALVGTIAAAVIGATATITVALLQRKESGPTTVTFAPPSHTTSVLDVLAVQNGVKDILINSYGVPSGQINSVLCPGDQEVRAGNKFTCTVELGGDNPAEKVVDITVRSNSGEYEVGHLRDR